MLAIDFLSILISNNKWLGDRHEQQVSGSRPGDPSLDGSKIKVNASKHKALSYQHACQQEEQIHAEVIELLKKAESAGQSDLPDGMNIPEELERREKRLAAIAEAKAKLEQRAAERHALEQAAQAAQGGSNRQRLN